MSASGYEEIRCERIVVRHFGGIDVLEVTELALPAPPPGHARLKVLAIGVSFTDLMARSGAVPAMKLDINPEWPTLITYHHGGKEERRAVAIPPPGPRGDQGIVKSPVGVMDMWPTSWNMLLATCRRP